METIDTIERFVKIIDDHTPIPNPYDPSTHQWVEICLCDIRLVTRSSANGHWVSVAIHSFSIGEFQYNLDDRMDMHITVGTWLSNQVPNSANTWDRQLHRACLKLQRTRNQTPRALRLWIVCNQNASCAGHVVYSLNVESLGGNSLVSIGQTLRSSGLVQKERPPRGMSPQVNGGTRCTVFHISVYGPV